MGVQYLEAWLRGHGAVPLFNLMEDAATAEISRAQVWQWIRHRDGRLNDGRKVTKELFRKVLEEELGKVQRSNGDRFDAARELFDQITTDDDFVEFLTLPGYEKLVKVSGERMKNSTSDWKNDPRWKGVTRPYSLGEVQRLQGSVFIEHTLARRGAEKLWDLLQTEPYVPTLGALTGNQAVQQARAGLKAIYLSGWQVAADANLAGQMYPDQSLYPANSVPAVVRRINQALQRADQIDHAEGRSEIDWFLPIVADAEAGFGGPLNVFELIKAMIEAGAAGVHLEDQLASEKKCGHMGGKVLVPTRTAVGHLIAGRLAADVSNVPTVLMARTDANAAALLTSDIDERDHAFLTGERTPEGFFRVKAGIDQAIARGLSYAPYVDMLWCETATPNLDEAKKFAEAFARRVSGQTPRLQLLALLQLEGQARERDDRQVSARTRRDGLQVPVRHPGRISRS